MMTKAWIYLSLFVFFILRRRGEGACTFPASLAGTWTINNKYIHVNSTHLTGFSVDIYNSLSFTCFNQQTDAFVMRSSHVMLLFGEDVFIYMCWKIKKQDSNTCLYYELSAPVSEFSTDKAIAFPPNQIPSPSEVCTVDDSSVAPGHLHRD